MEKNKINLKISFNSPVVLTFSIICLAALILGIVTGDRSTLRLFSVYRAPFSDPLTYFRFFGHVFGHAGWDHFIGNITMLLVVGPMLEEKYGSKNILFV
ncbi:MAG TPA: rhomboid family intramembrane serine protease, partial [Ruminococcus flavefaciens]|nr:rhomboid family intramembrane serine protease [Ruminococcus flavefaciens]